MCDRSERSEKLFSRIFKVLIDNRQFSWLKIGLFLSPKMIQPPNHLLVRKSKVILEAPFIAEFRP